MPPIQPPLVAGSPHSGTPLANLCALCNGQRLIGSLLAFSPAGGGMLWVCDDCQHKLARRVDDEGALGG